MTTKAAILEKDVSVSKVPVSLQLAEVIKYAKIKTVERMYGCGRFTLFRWIREGSIRTVLIKKTKRSKGYHLVDLASLEAYLNSQAVK